MGSQGKGTGCIACTKAHRVGPLKLNHMQIYSEVGPIVFYGSTFRIKAMHRIVVLSIILVFESAIDFREDKFYVVDKTETAVLLSSAICGFSKNLKLYSIVPGDFLGFRKQTCHED